VYLPPEQSAEVRWQAKTEKTPVERIEQAVTLWQFFVPQRLEALPVLTLAGQYHLFPQTWPE
jgi:hypothetical protein